MRATGYSRIVNSRFIERPQSEVAGTSLFTGA